MHGYHRNHVTEYNIGRVLSFANRQFHVEYITSHLFKLLDCVNSKGILIVMTAL